LELLEKKVQRKKSIADLEFANKNKCCGSATSTLQQGAGVLSRTSRYIGQLRSHVTTKTELDLPTGTTAGKITFVPTTKHP